MHFLTLVQTRTNSMWSAKAKFCRSR